MAGIRDWVSCFDSLEEAMIRNRVVQNAQSRRSWSDCARRFESGSPCFTPDWVSRTAVAAK